ncbi:MAG TPA: divalent-cation tolerance protein CutA [Alphaproteobacteria bacterium]|nr:divalent-cation tolerance protein CutA [Alphaproteobacteria bacterium]
MTDFISIHITTSSVAEAEKIAHALVEEKLAACANIVPGVKSIYRWKDKVEAGDEVYLLVKTRAELFGAVEAKVKDLHSYECPCIVALPITDGHQPFLDWLAESTQSL